MKHGLRKLAVAALTLMLLTTSVGGVAFTAGASHSGGGPQVATPAETTIASYNMSWGDNPLTYEDNQGDVQTMDAHVNQSADNPISFVATDIEFEDAGAFPHNKENVSSLEQSEWSEADLTVTNTETAPGVDAANFATNGSMTSGDVATATFDNFSIKSDEAKKQLATAVDVNSIDAGAVVQIRVIDADGDAKVAEINTSRSTGNDLIANATGEGYVLQAQLGELATEVNGDGTFDNIQSVEVVAMDGEADVSVSLLNLDKTSQYKLGTMAKDTDDDDDLESVVIHQVNETGPISITELSTMGDSFSKATIHNLVVDAIHNHEVVESEFNVTQDRPGYYGTATVTVETGLFSAYDVSYANAETSEMQPLISDRYLSVEYAEGVSEDDDISEISDSAWSDKTDLYSEEGKNVTVDSTIQPGQTSYVTYKVQLQKDEFNTWQNAVETNTGGGGGGGAEAGGLLSGINGLIAGGLSAIATLLGYLKFWK